MRRRTLYAEAALANAPRLRRAIGLLLWTFGPARHRIGAVRKKYAALLGRGVETTAVAKFNALRQSGASSLDDYSIRMLIVDFAGRGLFDRADLFAREFFPLGSVLRKADAAGFVVKTDLDLIRCLLRFAGARIDSEWVMALVLHNSTYERPQVPKDFQLPSTGFVP